MAKTKVRRHISLSVSVRVVSGNWVQKQPRQYESREVFPDYFLVLSRMALYGVFSFFCVGIACQRSVPPAGTLCASPVHVCDDCTCYRSALGALGDHG